VLANRGEEGRDKVRQKERGGKGRVKGEEERQAQANAVYDLISDALPLGSRRGEQSKRKGEGEGEGGEEEYSELVARYDSFAPERVSSYWEMKGERARGKVRKKKGEKKGKKGGKRNATGVIPTFTLNQITP